MDYNNPGSESSDYPDNGSFEHTLNTYRAYVNAVIPRTPKLAEEFGRIQFYGALDLNTDEYLIMTLDYLYTPLAEPIAVVLDIAAEQFIYEEGYRRIQDSGVFPGWGGFSDLSAANRFYALTLLEQNSQYFVGIPAYFRENVGYLRAINTTLSRYTMMGYYSEWSGYGNTRLDSPNQRILEFFPLSWKQIDYPGPSLGYHALRTGFI